MPSNDNQRQTIYYRPLNQWIEVTAEEKRNWENFVGAHRKAQQRAGKCCVPYKRCYKCDANCDGCEYRCKAKDEPQILSIDEEMRRVYEGESSYSGFLADDALTAEIDLEHILINNLLAELKATDPNSYMLLILYASGLSERECAEQLGLPRNTYVSRRDKLFEILHKKL